MGSEGAYGFLGDYLLWWALYLSLLGHIVCFFKFFPRARRRTAGLILGNGLVFCGLLATVALAAETYLRFVRVEIDAFGVSLPARRWFERHVRLNSLGCRDREWSQEKPPGIRRIAVIGDSFTYGWGIEDVADRFTDRLQRRFDEQAPGTVEVMNVAKPAWDTTGQAAALSDLLSTYAIDEVVLAFVPNDIEKLIPKRPGFDPTLPPEPVLVNISSSSLVDYLYRRLVLPRAATVTGYHDWLAGGYADPAVWRSHQARLFDMVRLCGERGVTLRVVLLPFLRTSGERYNSPRLHAIIEQFFQANHVPVVDLLPVIAGRDPADLTVSVMDSHPNETAHATFAEAIWRAFYAH
jgi:lysophospholipase L1-like esterase